MSTRHDITKKYAHVYGRASKTEKGRLLDELCATTGWSRVNARRAIRMASQRTGPASAVTRRPRPRKYSYDVLLVLQRVWDISGQSCGKYLAPVMDATLDKLTRFHEFGPVTHRVTHKVLQELQSMSPAPIDRYLAAHKKTLFPEALSGTTPGHLLRQSIPVHATYDGRIDEIGFLELDTVAHCVPGNVEDCYTLIRREEDRYPVAWMARLVGVDRRRYYEWVQAQTHLSTLREW